MPITLVASPAARRAALKVSRKFSRKFLPENPAAMRRRYLVNTVKMIGAQKAVIRYEHMPRDEFDQMIAGLQSACRVWRNSAASHGYRLP